MESCLLSRITITSLINLLPSAERGLWVREMTYFGLDFRNPEGSYTLACFKKMCIIKWNTNENYRETSTTVPSSSTLSSKKVQASNHLLSEKNKKVPVQEVCVMTVKNSIEAFKNGAHKDPKDQTKNHQKVLTKK